MDIMLFGKVQRIAVAVRQLRGILCCAGIYRAYRMNDILCFQPVALSDFCFSGAAAVQRAALRQQFRPCCPVDSTIHAAATQIAVDTVTDWLQSHVDYDMRVIFCCFDARTAQVYQTKME